MAAGLVLALATSSCSALAADPDRIQVAILWGGDEREQFRQVVDAYEVEMGRTVELVNAGDDMDAFLRAQHRSGDLPDVAVLPQPGLVRDYADRGWLEPLDEDDHALSDRYPDFWRALGTADDGHFYGAWIKAAYKSAFWCLPDPDDREECDSVEDRPETWEELLSTVDLLAREEASPAPLAVGAADGWVLTDWLEALLAVEVEESLYDALAEGEPRWDAPAVRAALGELARVWGVEGAFAPPGADRALLTQFDESVIQVAAIDQAALFLGGDFAQRIADDLRTDESDTWSLLPFPLLSPEGVEPLVVGGDAAVVFRGSEHGADLVDWLTDPLEHPARFLPWLRTGGYLSPLPETYDLDLCREEAAADPSCVLSYFLGWTVTGLIDGVEAGDTVDDGDDGVPDGDETGEGERPSYEVRFDLSDQLPRECAERLEGVLRDYFAEVAERGDVSSAVRERSVRATAGALNDAVEDDACRR